MKIIEQKKKQDQKKPPEYQSKMDKRKFNVSIMFSIKFNFLKSNTPQTIFVI